MNRRIRVLLIAYLLLVAFLLLYVPWQAEQRYEANVFTTPVSYGWMWAKPEPPQGRGPDLQSFGARWASASADDEIKAALRGDTFKPLPPRWDFQDVKDFIHINWRQIGLELGVVTALAAATLLGCIKN